MPYYDRYEPGMRYHDSLIFKYLWRYWGGIVGFYGSFFRNEGGTVRETVINRSGWYIGRFKNGFWCAPDVDQYIIYYCVWPRESWGRRVIITFFCSYYSLHSLTTSHPQFNYGHCAQVQYKKICHSHAPKLLITPIDQRTCTNFMNWRTKCECTNATRNCNGTHNKIYNLGWEVGNIWRHARLWLCGTGSIVGCSPTWSLVRSTRMLCPA